MQEIVEWSNQISDLELLNRIFEFRTMKEFKYVQRENGFIHFCSNSETLKILKAFFGVTEHSHYHSRTMFSNPIHAMKWKQNFEGHTVQRKNSTVYTTCPNHCWNMVHPVQTAPRSQFSDKLQHYWLTLATRPDSSHILTCCWFDEKKKNLLPAARDKLQIFVESTLVNAIH